MRGDTSHHPFSETSVSIPSVDYDIGDPREDRIVGHRPTKPDLLVGVQEHKNQRVLDHLDDDIPRPADTPIGFRKEIKGSIHIDPASIVCDNKVVSGPFHRGYGLLGLLIIETYCYVVDGHAICSMHPGLVGA
jgi:hypothetical protein